MSIYDMARFGLLYLNGGEWQGEQIVPAEWVEQSTTLQFERNSGSAITRAEQVFTGGLQIRS